MSQPTQSVGIQKGIGDFLGNVLSKFGLHPKKALSPLHQSSVQLPTELPVNLEQVPYNPHDPLDFFREQARKEVHNILLSPKDESRIGSEAALGGERTKLGMKPISHATGLPMSKASAALVQTAMEHMGKLATHRNISSGLRKIIQNLMNSNPQIREIGMVPSLPAGYLDPNAPSSHTPLKVGSLVNPEAAEETIRGEVQSGNIPKPILRKQKKNAPVESEVPANVLGIRPALENQSPAHNLESEQTNQTVATRTHGSTLSSGMGQEGPSRLLEGKQQINRVPFSQEETNFIDVINKMIGSGMREGEYVPTVLRQGSELKVRHAPLGMEFKLMKPDATNPEHRVATTMDLFLPEKKGYRRTRVQNVQPFEDFTS